MAHTHIVPAVERVEHDLDDCCACLCEPETHFINKDTGLPWPDGDALVIHNRFRGRDTETKWEVIH